MNVHATRRSLGRGSPDARLRELERLAAQGDSHAAQQLIRERGLDNEDEMRLACMTQINGDIEVETNPEFNLFGENFFS